MTYIDSNLFIYAALYDDERGEKARKFLEHVRVGKEVSYTSSLTFDEVFWIVKKEKDIDSALEIVRAMLEMRNLKFVTVDTSLLWESYKLIKKYGVGPRDSIHIVCALNKNEEKIISEDRDFDDIEEIEREWIV